MSESSVAAGDEQKKFEVTLYISVACGAVTFALFCLIHRRSFFYWYWWYAPNEQPVNNPFLLSFWRSLVAWIPQSFIHSDKRIWKEKGADAIMHIRFLRICFLLTGMMALFGSAVILPINIRGKTTEQLPDLGYLTISNLDGDDTKLIAHVVFTYFYSLVSYFIIWFYYLKYAELRKKYLNKNEVKGYSVILRNVPGRLRDDGSIRGWFEDHFDGMNVISSRVVWNDKILRKLRKKRVRYLNKLEVAEQDLAEFTKFKRKWNKKLTEIKRKRDKREWKSLREKQLMDSQAGAEASRETEAGEASSSEEEIEIANISRRNDLTNSTHLSSKDNFILTLSGDRLSYATLNDIEDGRLDSAKGKETEEPHKELPDTKVRDTYNEDTHMHRARQKSCCYWFLYEWRKWKWKMKNRTILRFFVGDLNRNSDKVPHRLALLIDEEIATINYFKQKIAKLSARIQEVQAHPEKHLPKTGTAFVVFDSMALPRMTIQPFLEPHRMMVAAAPEPNDVSWKTLHPSYRRLLISRGIIIVFLTLMAVAWGFPSFFCASLYNLQSLSDLEGFEWIQTRVNDRLSGYARSLVEGFAPAIGLVLLLVTAKHIIRFVIRRSCEHAKSTIEWKTMSTYWSFLIIHVLFVSTLGGTLTKILDEFIDNPRDLITLLAKAFPQNSIFFINYILVVTFCITPLTLFRFRQILQQFAWYVLMRPSTLRQKAHMWRHPKFDYAGSAAQGLLIYTVTLFYSLMSPLIAVFGLCYFLVVYLVDRYQIIYTTRTTWQGGGTMWPLIFHMFMASIMLFQLAMIGILSLTKFGGGAVLAVLPFLTAGIWVLLHFQWITVSSSGPINGVATIKPLSYEAFRTAYVQPSMRDVAHEDSHYAKTAVSASDSSYERDVYSNDFSDEEEFEEEQELTDDYTYVSESDDMDDELDRTPASPRGLWVARTSSTESENDTYLSTIPTRSTASSTTRERTNTDKLGPNYVEVP